MIQAAMNPHLLSLDSMQEFFIVFQWDSTLGDHW